MLVDKPKLKVRGSKKKKKKLWTLANVTNGGEHMSDMGEEQGADGDEQTLT